MEDARAWQNQPLADLYPVVFLDALVLEIRDGGTVQRKACYLALAINLDGDREVLGMWRQRGREVLDAGSHRAEGSWRPGHPHLLVDGLKGFPGAIEAVFPATTVQTRIVHLIRASLRYVPRWQFDAVTNDLKPICTAINPDQALLALEAFEQKWVRGVIYPTDESVNPPIGCE